MIIPFFIPINTERQSEYDDFDLTENPMDELSWKINIKWMIVYKTLLVLSLLFFVALLIVPAIFIIYNISGKLICCVALYIATSLTFFLAVVAHQKSYYK